MIKPTYKSHSVILSSILESSCMLTTIVSRTIDLVIPTISEQTTHEIGLLIETRSNLTTLETNLKFLEVKVDSEFKNDNEFFLDVVQLLECDVLPIFNQCFKLFDYISNLEPFQSIESVTFDALLKILTNLKDIDSFETLIGNFATFLSKCLKFSTSFKTNELYDTDKTHYDENLTIEMATVASSHKEGSFELIKPFDYESDYYSLVCKLDTINDLLKKLETSLDELEDEFLDKPSTLLEKTLDEEDDIFGFDYDYENECSEKVESSNIGINFNYRLNFRKKLALMV